jgi:type III secretory pathway lipoprotein EscJ
VAVTASGAACVIAGALAAPCIIAGALAACAPIVDGPIEHQRAIDRDDGDRLAMMIARLPGVVHAEIALHHPVRDPLAIAPASPAAFSAVITTDDRANAEALRAAIARLAHATLPELAELAADAPLAIELDAQVHRPELAKVGPFAVEASSRGPLRAALSVALLAIIALASVIAVRTVRDRQRRGSSAQ